MAIRAKAKAFFRRSRNNNNNNSDDNLSKTDSTDSHERWPSNVYKPGEPMPRPKYRQPPKKEHKEHLDSFSFADAWRRKSFQSQYSPMGTRAPSRLPSAAPSRRSSWYSRKKSMSYGRSGSVTSVDSHKSAGAVKRESSQKSRRSEIERKPSQRSAPPLSRSSSFKSPRREPNHNTTHAAVATRLSTEQEEEGDDDVFNVGMSRVQSHERYPLSRQRSLNERPPAGYIGDSLNKSMTSHHDSIQAHDHHPFTEQELALALKRSHLTVPGQA